MFHEAYHVTIRS